MALASTSKAVELWTDQVCSIFPDEGKLELVTILKLTKLVPFFFSKAFIDLIKLMERIMLSSVMARRALCFRPWVADLASKQI